MLKSRNNFIRNYLSVSLTEQHMATLASIIKDVDKDVKGECGCDVKDVKGVWGCVVKEKILPRPE